MKTMSIWNADLTTEDGALGAAQMGGYACFVAAVLGAIALAFMFGMIRLGNVMPLVGLAALAEILVYVVAGFRLHAGKGFYWGIAAAVLLALGLAFKIAALAVSIAMFVNLLLLVVTINGVRGARALRSGRFDADEVADVFG
ncbi:MAG: hypothetical protein V4574_10085 [Pseudomonadota bacterium]